ncbi:DUF6886 family protein [Guptibacillus algicola]|uniref:DUF6886 family protein n=1 Tax=Guptibacillus algicola TaxID=225844 RepID=UPI001CD65CF3|nr:DUF6886 family protein [Alkalihalobacillus algicola]MCA0987416.1 hypothetical protein [Alkalihalobacillus algicola]
MRLFHVSEESDIDVFEPRVPTRKDLDESTGLVWAIEERCLPNFLTPRDCPRVCYNVGRETTDLHKQTYLSSEFHSHVVVIEQMWFEVMKNTTLFLYEFDPAAFQLQDENAGYYVSESTQIPIAKWEVNDLFQALFSRGVEVRFVDNLWEMYDAIQQTTFCWSMCKMGNAKPRTDE